MCPGEDVPFDQCRVDVLPSHTVSEMVSLLSVRFNTLDPLLVEAVKDSKVLEDAMTLYDAGVKEEDKVLIRFKPRGWCCVLA